MIAKTFDIFALAASARPAQRAVIIRRARDLPRLRVIRREEDFLALESCWDRLLEESAVRTPFLRWDWVSLWWRQYRGSFKLAIGVLFDVCGEPVAIAPLVIGREPSGYRRWMRQITFMGGMGDIVSEGMDLIIPQGREAAFAPLLGEVFHFTRSEWDAVCLPMLAADSPNHAHIFESLRKVGDGVAIAARQPSRLLSLPESWQEFEMSRSAHWRSMHRRKWRKVTQDRGGRALLAGRDLPFDAAYRAMLDLHRQRWNALDNKFLLPATQQFHRNLVALWAPQGKIMIPLLELDGGPAAAVYNFVDFGKAWQYQMGWNTDFADLSIGRMCIAHAVQHSIELGLQEFDFLPGDYEHKKQWTDQTRFVEELEAFNPVSPSAMLFRTLRRVKRLLSRPVVPAGNPSETSQ